MIAKKLPALIFCVFFPYLIHGFEPKITGADLSLAFSPEYNRALRFSWNLDALGTLEFNNALTFKGGIASGQTGEAPHINMTLAGEFGLTRFISFPLYVSLVYLYNGLPLYQSHANTLLPLIGIKGRRAGISLGPSLRFTAFYGAPALFEPVFSFQVYVNPYYTERLVIGLVWANYHETAAGNMGSYSLGLKTTAGITKQLKLINEITIYQSGSVALAADFYGIAYRGGVVLQW